MTDDAIVVLARDPLRHIVLLKHIVAHPDDVQVHQLWDRAAAATLVLLATAANSYDRQAYPAAQVAALISSDHPDLTGALLDLVPRDVGVVFKLSSDADRDAVAARFPIEPTTRYLSFTTAAPFRRDDQVELTVTPGDAMLDLFETQGHDRGWLRDLLRSGRAFVAALQRDGQLLAACFAFENHGPVWEVGGVCTPPAFRRQGHAARVVRTALAELASRRLVARYQVHHENAPSIRLADSLGLRRFLTLTHFLHDPARRG
ncbi:MULTISPECIES: GNAT family N-acetyltransferase [Inquilinus]|jgi:ribosomal protein S18 acetylase RimI-like enzyme|uniref:Ribosomal protein S18 acetylase RimI-like enzyme n=1 Tax=Inquilinus ginsengisoli TaxID=363840 RepID=A0ABU1JLS6_9PROT|nr:GNAT family N-acetyltransferase [Inquilinus ginsengisoli]MDR6288495.1 ribosomal protein S18 acetylase RimI-like enzyme [Inquilinus ginsengisoli]